MTARGGITEGRKWLNGIFQKIQRGNITTQVTYQSDGVVTAFLFQNQHTDAVWYGELLSSEGDSEESPEYAIARLEPLYSRKNPDPMELARNPTAINEREFDGCKCLITTQRIDLRGRVNRRAIAARVTDAARRIPRPTSRTMLHGRNRAAQYIASEFDSLHQTSSSSEGSSGDE